MQRTILRPRSRLPGLSAPLVPPASRVVPATKMATNPRHGLPHSVSRLQSPPDFGLSQKGLLRSHHSSTNTLCPPKSISSLPQNRYPGVDLDVHRLRRWSQEFKDYPVCGGFDEILLPLREIFMMTLMDRLTDKPGWQKKVFDEEIVARWRVEALQQSELALFNEIVYRSRQGARRDEQSDEQRPSQLDHWTEPNVPFPRCRIISHQCFDYVSIFASSRLRIINNQLQCIQELREKARYFEKTGYVPTLDAIGRVIIKSDTLVEDGLRQELVALFKKLRSDQSTSDAGLDWHPNTNEKVLDLVHPSLYPFVYGRPCSIITPP